MQMLAEKLWAGVERKIGNARFHLSEMERALSKRLGSLYVSGRSRDWLKFKNPDAPAVKREFEEDWERRGGGGTPNPPMSDARGAYREVARMYPDRLIAHDPASDGS
jgi:hypothetical protein